MEIQNSKDYAKVYVARNFIEKGVCEYADERVYLSAETLNKVARSLKGRPVIIDHVRGITPENMQKYAVGYVTQAICSMEGQTALDCEFVVFDDEGKRVLADGYSVSCAYTPKAFGPGGTWHNVPYDREITDLEFTHLALVQNPRYEDAKVYENAKDKDGQDGRWITVKGSRVFIKEGQSIEDAMKDRRKDKSSDQKTSKRKAKLEKIKNEVQSEIEKIYADYEDLKEYFVVDTKFKENYYDDGSDMYAIEVRGELDYKSMTQLGDKLDKMVQKYDKYAYFDQEEPGIMTAVIDFDNGVEKHNAKDRDGQDGRWITIKGTHVFIKDGQSVEEVIDQKFKGSEGHEAKRTSKIHQDIHDRYEALKEETERQKKELKGKYEREDADFDEEQVLQDIEEARSFGYETIDDISEFLGLDPDEVMELTGESYDDGEDNDSVTQDRIIEEQLDELEDQIRDAKRRLSKTAPADRKTQANIRQEIKDLESMYDYKSAKLSKKSVEVNKKEEGRVDVSKFEFKDFKNPDGQTYKDGKRSTYRKTLEDVSSEIEMIYDRAVKDPAQWGKSLTDDMNGALGHATFRDIKDKNVGGAKQAIIDRAKDLIRKYDSEALKKKSDNRSFEGYSQDILKRAKVSGAEGFQSSKDGYSIKFTIPEQTFREREKALGKMFDKDGKVEKYDFGGSINGRTTITVRYKKEEKHNNKEERMNIEEFFNKMGEMIEEKLNACKSKMNKDDDEDEDDDDKFEMDGEVYSKKELVNAFKEKKNAEEDDEEEKQNGKDDEYFNKMEELLNSNKQESDKIEVYSQQKGIELGRQIYGK